MLSLKDTSLLQNHCLIDGAWKNAANGSAIEVRNPANNALVGTVPCLHPDEISHVIACAEKAFHRWKNKTAKERSLILRRWFELMLENAEDLATIMTAEQGKPLSEAKGEILYAASFVEWFAEEGKRTDGDVLPSPSADRRLLVIRQPVGVCAAITPWNFPSAMITRKAAPALAAGCTMIVRPASATPLSALALGELALRAGVPSGVLQIVTGSHKIGMVLAESDKIRKLSFTGSTEVGRLLLAACAPTLKRVSLELGGNASFIVFDDADLDAAAEGAIVSKYRNAGQTCVCANRFYVQSGVYDAFAERLVKRVASLKVGEGTEQGVAIGPLINQAGLEKVEIHVWDAIQKGARLLTGGKPHDLGGLFYEPTVLSEVDQTMLITQEETFGPVAPLIRFETEEEAVTLANATEYGLASYFYTQNTARFWRVAEAVQSGMIGHNTGLISNEVAPFGGVKQSGLGREGSKYGILEYLDTKYICSAL